MILHLHIIQRKHNKSRRSQGTFDGAVQLVAATFVIVVDTAESVDWAAASAEKSAGSVVEAAENAAVVASQTLASNPGWQLWYFLSMKKTPHIFQQVAGSGDELVALVVVGEAWDCKGDDL